MASLTLTVSPEERKRETDFYIEAIAKLLFLTADGTIVWEELAVDNSSSVSPTSPPYAQSQDAHIMDPFAGSGSIVPAVRHIGINRLALYLIAARFGMFGRTFQCIYKGVSYVISGPAEPASKISAVSENVLLFVTAEDSPDPLLVPQVEGLQGLYRTILRKQKQTSRSINGSLSKALSTLFED